MLWLTADLHFDHANIIKHCGRPFEHVHHMNRSLVHNWNACVGERDIVYVLGDFAWMSSGAEAVTTWLLQLNGRKVLIRGNHDNNHAVKSAGWASVHERLKVRHEGERMILSHYAQRVWEGHGRGHWHLYGHSHGNLPPLGLSFDVGVDCSKHICGRPYSPISFDEVARHMQHRKQHVTDHHGARNVQKQAS